MGESACLLALESRAVRNCVVGRVIKRKELKLWKIVAVNMSGVAMLNVRFVEVPDCNIHVNRPKTKFTFLAYEHSGKFLYCCVCFIATTLFIIFGMALPISAVLYNTVGYD